METEEGLLELAPYVLPSIGKAQQAPNTVKLEGALCFSKQSRDLLASVESADTKRCIFRRFVEECIVQSKLRHPNVLQFLGVYLGEGPFDITMVTEHAHTDLDQFLRARPSIPLHLFDKVSVLFDVSAGLRYLHSRNPPVAHRELTARNIFLSADMRAKIGDMGVLTVLDGATNHLSLSAREMAADSLVYMAPEARKQLSKRGLIADVYSFGVIALFAVTQVSPCVDPSVAKVGDDFRGKWLNLVGKDHGLYEVISKCIEDAPSSRPTAAEVNEWLETIRGGLEPTGLRMRTALVSPTCDNNGQMGSHEDMPQKTGVAIDLKRVAKLQMELVEARTQIKQIERALKEMKSQFDIRNKSEQETLEKVYREIEMKDKELQMNKIQLEELRTECARLRETKVSPPLQVPNSKIGLDLPPLPAKSPPVPPEGGLRPPAKSPLANIQRNPSYEANNEPQLYEEPVETLSTCPWFYANLDVISAESKLHAKNWTGAYLVRESTSMKGQYTLSLLYNCDVRHMRIVELYPKKFTLDNATFFSSVRSLIQHYRMHPLYLETGGRTILKDENY